MGVNSGMKIWKLRVEFAELIRVNVSGFFRLMLVITHS